MTTYYETSPLKHILYSELTTMVIFYNEPFLMWDKHIKAYVKHLDLSNTIVISETSKHYIVIEIDSTIKESSLVPTC